VVVTGPARSASFGPEQVRQLLASIGSPAPVLGFWPHDPPAARGLWEGQLTRRLAGSSLLRSARSIAETALATWPQLIPPPPTPPAATDHTDHADQADRAFAPAGTKRVNH
jgi:hypothetical protein